MNGIGLVDAYTDMTNQRLLDNSVDCNILTSRSGIIVYVIVNEILRI